MIHQITFQQRTHDEERPKILSKRGLNIISMVSLVNLRSRDAGFKKVGLVMTIEPTEIISHIDTSHHFKCSRI
jgi:hypothetical protein